MHLLNIRHEVGQVRALHRQRLILFNKADLHTLQLKSAKP
jgi:hypothetical protein